MMYVPRSGSWVFVPCFESETLRLDLVMSRTDALIKFCCRMRAALIGIRIRGAPLRLWTPLLLSESAVGVLQTGLIRLLKRFSKYGPWTVRGQVRLVSLKVKICTESTIREPTERKVVNVRVVRVVTLVKENWRPFPVGWVAAIGGCYVADAP